MTMRDSAIRHLAACDESSLIAAAFFESRVQIWNSDKAQLVGEFETVLDFGGRRLVLAAGGSICVTGSWKRGLAAYSVPDGTCLWNRDDLTHLQLLTLSASGLEVNCGFENRPLMVMDVRTGALRETVKGALRIFCSRFGHHELVQERKRYRLAGERMYEIPSMSFGLSDATFSADAICIAEPNAGIRCFETDSGVQLWQHKSLKSNRVTFCSLDENFYCLAIGSKNYDCSLIRLAPKLIDCDQVAFVGPCSESAFSQCGKVFVSSRGDVYETSTGRLIAELDFPEQDYAKYAQSD